MFGYGPLVTKTLLAEELIFHNLHNLWNLTITFMSLEHPGVYKNKCFHFSSVEPRLPF